MSSFCSPRLGSGVPSSLIRRPHQSSHSREKPWPFSQRLSVPTHVEASSQWSKNHCADAPQRGGSLGVNQVNKCSLLVQKNIKTDIGYNNNNRSNRNNQKENYVRNFSTGTLQKLSLLNYISFYNIIIYMI